MAHDAIIHNSPALDSLRHQQLRSLCARHHLKSTGKKDVLIQRLKALRDREDSSSGDHQEEVNEEHQSSSHAAAAAAAEESYELVDADPDRHQQRRAASTQDGLHLSAVAEEAEPRPSTSTLSSARIQTDEFGALALSMDAGTITKSSSLKSIVSKLFGGSTSSNSTITASASSGSLSSLSGGNTTLTHASSTSSVTLRSDVSGSGYARPPKSSAESAVDPIGPLPVSREDDRPSLTAAAAAASASAPAASPKPTYRIIDETSFLTSIADSTSANPRPSIEIDASFAPRSSFDDDSLALANVPCWPPRSPGAPGVVIISPRQSPPKVHGAAAHPPPSAGGKRRFDDDGDDASEGDSDGDDKLDDYFHAIRMLPQRGLTPASPAHGENSLYLSPTGPSASGRKIARVPKRYSLLAGSPPKFDKDAPALPSLTGMMLASLASDQQAAAAESALEADKQSSLNGTSAGIDISPPRSSAPAFTFGSPIQQPHIFSPPPPAKEEAAPAAGQGDFLAKQLEEMQRRLATTSSSLSSTKEAGMLTIAEGGHGMTGPVLGQRESLFAGLMGEKATTGVRFEGHHDKEFQKMDSIANHYAAKRTGPAFVPSKRTKTDAPPMSRQASSSSISTLHPNLNQQGRAAPMIPPRPELGGPKMAKIVAQQQENRRRILDYSSGTGPLQRDGKARHIRRKSTAMGTATTPRRARMADPGQRRLPPSPEKIAPPVPVIPTKPTLAPSASSSSLSSKATSAIAGSSSSRMGFLKNSMASLRSFASSGSLSSKSGSGSVTVTAPAEHQPSVPVKPSTASGKRNNLDVGPGLSRAQGLGHSASMGNLVSTASNGQRPTPATSGLSYCTSSLMRPTAASLAKAAANNQHAHSQSQASGPLTLKHAVSTSAIPVLSSSPAKKAVDASANRLYSLMDLPAPSTREPAHPLGNLPSPPQPRTHRAGLASTSPAKKRMSSLFTANRGSPHKAATVADARQLREKRERQRSARGISALGAVGEQHQEASSTGLARTGSIAAAREATTQGSLSGRPAWR